MNPIELPVTERLYYFADGSFILFEQHDIIINGKMVTYGKTLLRRNAEYCYVRPVATPFKEVKHACNYKAPCQV